MKRLPFPKDQDVFTWGPIPGRPLFTSWWYDSLYARAAQKYPGYAWPHALYLFRDGMQVYISPYDTFYREAENPFYRYMLKPKKMKVLWCEYHDALQKFNTFAAELDTDDIATWSDATLLKRWNRLHTLFIDVFRPICVVEYGNYAAPHVIEKALIRHGMPSSDLMHVMEILMTPEEPSFYQKEEIALQAARDLKAHRKKYRWLHNSYAHAEELSLDFFVKRQKDLDPNLERTLEERFANIRQEKICMQKAYNIPGEIMDMANVATRVVAWQDDRKMHIFRFIQYQDWMVREIAKRHNQSYRHLLQMGFDEIMQFLQDGRLPHDVTVREKGYGWEWWPDGKQRRISHEEVSQLWECYLQHDVQTDMVRGTVASKGSEKMIRGRARIIMNPHTASPCRHNEILIASMTSPDYINVMRSSRAVITDTGGLTSHAAVVSRELNIPCIVGTKYATRIFKDGDIVDIDIANGIVKKLNNKVS